MVGGRNVYLPSWQFNHRTVSHVEHLDHDVTGYECGRGGECDGDCPPFLGIGLRVIVGVPQCTEDLHVG